MGSCVIIRGGLGNQLFQLFTAYSISANGRSPAVIDVSTYRHPSQELLGRKFELESFARSLGIKIVNVPRSQFRLRIHLALQTALRRLSRGLLAVILTRVGVFVRDRADLDSEDMSQLARYWYLDGFFFGGPHQLERQELFRQFLDRLTDHLGVSSSARTHWIRLSSDVAVHLRLGDFKTVGAERIIEPRRLAHLLTSLGSNSATLFSDEPNVAHEILRPYFQKQLEFPGGNSDPLTTLASMSLSNSLVCSPSTFSWWAGAVCSHLGGTVYWPREFNDSKGLRKITEWVDY